MAWGRFWPINDQNKWVIFPISFPISPRFENHLGALTPVSLTDKHSRRIFHYFRLSIPLTNVQYKFCSWLDSNNRPLASEATAQPLPLGMLQVSYLWVQEHPRKWKEHPRKWMEVRDGLINILMASNAQMNLYLRKNMFFRLFFFLMSKHILIWLSFSRASSLLLLFLMGDRNRTWQK